MIVASQPLTNHFSPSFRESSQHVVRKTCAWIKHPPKAWWNLDESGVFVDYLVPENLVGWASFIFRWFSNIFPWNIGTSQPASLESQGMIPRGYATKHSPKVYCRICPSIQLFLVNRLGLVVSMGFIMSHHHLMCGFSCVRCWTSPGFLMVNKAATTVVVIIQNLLAESRFSTV